MRLPAVSRPRRILCVEDHEPTAAMLQLVLTSAGCEVVGCSDGGEAWEQFQAAPNRFDVVFTDHQMPRMDGLALVRRVREQGYQGRVVVHTGNLAKPERAQYLELKVDRIIEKPAPVAEIIASVG